MDERKRDGLIAAAGLTERVRASADREAAGPLPCEICNGRTLHYANCPVAGAEVYTCNSIAADVWRSKQAATADQQALLRVLGMLAVDDYRDAATAASSISIRQSASETPAAFVKRITVALLLEMAETP